MTYDFWQAALKEPHKIGSPDLPVHDGHPQPGFYRMPEGKDMIPVAIWRNREGKIIAKRGFQIVPKADEIWTWCCRNPVSEKSYRDVMDGGAWPDDPPAKKEPAKQVATKAEPQQEPALIGHNMPDDPFEALKLEYQGELEIAKELLASPVKDSDHADKIANFSKRVSAISNKADNLFKVEKQPFLDGGRAVDDKWRELREDAKALSAKLKRHIDDWLAEQRRAEAERQRKAEEEAAAARRAAEEAERKALQEARSEDEARIAQEKADRLKREAEAAEREAKARPVQAGRTGSKVSLRTFKTAKIVDIEKALMHLKDHEKVREIVQILANAAARSDIALPGCEVITEERAV